MSAIYIMLPVSLLLAGIFLVAYIWSVRSGQFEDTTTPAMRILPDDNPAPVESAILADVKPGILPGGKAPVPTAAPKNLSASSDPNADPGGGMPPFTSGKMPDATFPEASDSDSNNQNKHT